MEVLVVGAGIAGLSAAIALARSGHRVTVLEAQKELTTVGAGIQMPPNATKVFRDWNILQEVQQKASLPKYVCFRSYRDGRILHKQELWPETEEKFGSPHLQIHRRELIQILANHALELHVSFKFGSTAEHIELPVVRTSEGESFSADLVIGADGERSICRSLILGQPNALRPTGTLVYRFNVDPQALFEDSELSGHLEFPILCSWLGPNAHAVVYSLDYNNIVTVAITCPDPIQGRVQIGPMKADMRELKSLLGNWDRMFLKLLDLGTDLRFWTLLELPEENRHWIDSQSQRMILIGDAAHSMTPYLAQGASQSIEDGAFLGCLFPSDSRIEEIPDRLKLFCQRRQPRSLEVRARARTVGDVFQMADGLAQQARDDQMRQCVPGSNFPNPFADPFLKSWLYGYDVKADAETAIVQIN